MLLVNDRGGLPRPIRRLPCVLRALRPALREPSLPLLGRLRGEGPVLLRRGSLQPLLGRGLLALLQPLGLLRPPRRQPLLLQPLLVRRREFGDRPA